jgi:hypothetical protein
VKFGRRFARRLSLLIADLLLFLVLMVFLALGHYVIEWIPASPEKREFLEKVHFVLITGAWIFFSVILFIELALAFVKRVKEHIPHDAPGARE